MLEEFFKKNNMTLEDVNDRFKYKAKRHVYNVLNGHIRMSNAMAINLSELSNGKFDALEIKKHYDVIYNKKQLMKENNVCPYCKGTGCTKNKGE